MPLLTLTSDIGNQDYLVSAVKAQLLQINPDFRIIDISHNIPPFNYPQAAYICRGAVKNFPDFTYHIILVNLFESKPEQLLLAYYKNQYMVYGVNALFNMMLEEKPGQVIALALHKMPVKTTFYCSKIMGIRVNLFVFSGPIQNIFITDVSHMENNH